MSTTARRFAAFLVALLGSAFLVAPVAPAQAYPDIPCTVSLSASTVRGGSAVTATITSGTPQDLSLSAFGQTRTKANATELTATFRTPKVDRRTVVQVTGSCGSDQRGVNLTLLPDVAGDNVGGDTNGILPNTGGFSFWLVVLAGVLIVGGGVVVARRRGVLQK